MNDVDEQKKTKRGASGWLVAVAIAVPVLILAAAFSWFRDDRPDGVGGSVEQTVDRTGPIAPDRQGEFAVPQASMGDFDSGRQVPNQSGQADFWYQARTGSDRFFSTVGDTALAVLGRTESPSLSQVKSALQERPIQQININDMSPGLWIAVHTSEGNYAAYTIRSHAGISPGTIRLQYLLWISDGDERDERDE